MLKALALSMVVLVVAGCGGSGGEAMRASGDAAASSFAPAEEAAFHFRAASTPRGAWVVLLPGASGLTIFDDKEHYFRAAEALNSAGFDALVVDYKAAYRAAANPPELETGGKIAWVAERAVAWARSTGKIAAGEPGAIVAWSLGAEGLWVLLADEARVNGLGLKACAAYYPANEDGAALRTGVPLLILTGEKDDVTEAKGIRAMVDHAGSGSVTLRVYPDAQHGFDVASITKERTVRLLPLIGPSATFAFDAEASQAAAVELREFLVKRVK